MWEETLLGWEKWGSKHCIKNLKLQGDSQFYILGTTNCAVVPGLALHDSVRRKREKERGVYVN